MANIIKFKKPPKRRWRWLRSYERIAHQEHFCDHCMHYIMPGDMYRADVYATAEHIVVLRKHHEPTCPIDPMEEQEELERMMRDHDEREAAEKSADIAA
jgi:hypothetical protein